MYTNQEVIIETDTKLGYLIVEEVTVYTSDGDAVDNFYKISLNGEVKREKCSCRSAIGALAQYMGTM